MSFNFNYENEDELEKKREQQQNQRKSSLNYHKRQKQDRSQAQRLQDGYCEKINHFALIGIASKERVDKKRAKLEIFEQQTPKFVKGGASSSLRYIIIISALVIVVTLNFLLIHAPVEHLVTMAFDEDSWQAKLGTVIVPVSLLLLEIYIGINLHEAKLGYDQISDNDDYSEETQEEIDKQVRRWELAGNVMIGFTPFMILGTMFARENWYLPYNILTTLALMILAFVTDAAIVFGGKLVKESLDFAWFHITRFRLESSRYNWQNRYYQAGNNCAKYYHLYQRNFHEFNRKYPDYQLISYPFSQQVQDFIEEWMNKGGSRKKLGDK